MIRAYNRVGERFWDMGGAVVSLGFLRKTEENRGIKKTNEPIRGGQVRSSCT
jgi:hypothetical protein